jgi:hypothetical protein
MSSSFAFACLDLALPALLELTGLLRFASMVLRLSAFEERLKSMGARHRIHHQ